MTDPADPQAPDFAAALAAVTAQMRAVRPSPPEVIAVTKTKPADRIAAALAAGHRSFGENRVQEAAEKFPALRVKYPDLQLHLIGPLQTNKVKLAIELFDCIHSVDREKLVRALAREMEAQQRQIPCFLQVNTGEEPQKAGVLPTELPALYQLCQSLALPVIGLMCIPPVDETPALHFALLAELAADLGLPGLSMGMSGDYVTAARHGATHVRLGSVLFGARPAPSPTEQPA